MGRCARCGTSGLDAGMTLCDNCLRMIGSTMRELERQGIDPLDPDDPANPFAPPPPSRSGGGGCAVVAVSLLAIPPGVVAMAYHLIG